MDQNENLAKKSEEILTLLDELILEQHLKCVGRTIVEQLLETMRMRGGARGRRIKGDLPLPAGHVS